jgi:hypothetical protein
MGESMSKLITVTLPEEQWEATIKAIEVVCQQADRIAELEKEKIRAYDNGYEDGRKPNTEMDQNK